MRTSSRLSLSPPSRAASRRESTSLRELRSCSSMARSMRPSRNLRAWSARVNGVKGRRRGKERMPAAKRSKAASMRGSPACASAPMNSDAAMAKPIAFNSGTQANRPSPAQRFAYRSMTCSMLGRYSSSASAVKARMSSRLRRRCFSPSRNGTASGLNSSSTCGGFAPARATFLSSRTKAKASGPTKHAVGAPRTSMRKTGPSSRARFCRKPAGSRTNARVSPISGKENRAGSSRSGWREFVSTMRMPPRAMYCNGDGFGNLVGSQGSDMRRTHGAQKHIPAPFARLLISGLQLTRPRVSSHGGPARTRREMSNGLVPLANRRRVLTLLALGILAACGSGSQKDAVPFHAAPRPHFVFINGDFENDPIGTTPPSGWTLLNYLNANGVSGTASAPPSSFSALNLSGLGTGVNATYVVGGTALTQADPDLGTGQTFRFPLYGQRAARLNYKDATTYGKNKNANVLKQSMTVGLADVDPTDGQIHVRFAIVPVLENPSHAFNQQPYFYVELHNLTRGTTLYTGFNTAGQTGVPWHTTTSIATGNATQWLDWALVDIAPAGSALSAGDQVQLTVVASGCALGGHFGRVYLDGMGSTVPGPYVSASAPQSVNAGTTLTYTLRYANGGTTAALGAHVDQVTPPKTTFASVSGTAGCTTPAVGSAGTISCPIGTLNPGASGSFTVTVNVASTATGSIVNGNYSIGSVNSPTLLGAKVTTAVNASTTRYADIVVVKTASVTAVQPGATFTSGANNPLYTITIANNSTTDQIRSSLGRSVTFTDVIPSQLTGVTWACTVTRAGSGSGTATKCRDQGGG